MNHPQGLSNRIDAYLLQLRECLGELPPEEVTDILREIRGHILERAEANGELTEERLVAILKSLGRPEEIAPLYQADAAVVARERMGTRPLHHRRCGLRDRIRADPLRDRQDRRPRASRRLGGAP